MQHTKCNMQDTRSIEHAACEMRHGSCGLSNPYFLLKRHRPIKIYTLQRLRPPPSTLTCAPFPPSSPQSSTRFCLALSPQTRSLSFILHKTLTLDSKPVFSILPQPHPSILSAFPSFCLNPKPSAQFHTLPLPPTLSYGLRSTADLRLHFRRFVCFSFCA